MRAEHDDVPFAVVRRGYDRTEVEHGLRRMRTELDSALLARDVARDDLRMASSQLEQARMDAQESRAAIGEARAEIDRLAAAVAELSTIPSTVDGMSQRLQQMVQIAQSDADDMRRRATNGAAQVLGMAQAEADELQERSHAERAGFEAELRAAREALRDELEEGRAQLEGLRTERERHLERLDVELVEQRAAAEAELADVLDRRRTAVVDDLNAKETLARTEAIRIRDTAAREARELLAHATAQAELIRSEATAGVAEAHRELEELRMLQHQVSEQLTSVRALLDWTLPRMVPATPSAPELRLVESKPSAPAQVRTPTTAEPAPVIARPGVTSWSSAVSPADWAGEVTARPVAGPADPPPTSSWPATSRTVIDPAGQTGYGAAGHFRSDTAELFTHRPPSVPDEARDPEAPSFAARPESLSSGLRPADRPGSGSIFDTGTDTGTGTASDPDPGSGAAAHEPGEPASGSGATAAEPGDQPPAAPRPRPAGDGRPSPSARSTAVTAGSTRSHPEH